MTAKSPPGMSVLDGGSGRDDENNLGLLSLRAKGTSWEGIQKAGEVRSGGIPEGVGRLLVDSE